MTEASVRACDAVFSVAGDEIPGVVFGPAVTGEAIPQAPRFAVSFVSNIDSTLVGQELATFRFTRAGNEAPSLVEARCFDASGAAIAGSPLSLTD